MKLAVHIMLNSGARQFNEEISEKIAISFARYPQVSCRLHSCDPSSIGTEISKAVKSSADIICAAGGDGTVSLVVNYLIDNQLPLGIVPLGTLNHLAKDLGIPLDLDKSVDVVCSGRTAEIDVGEVNGNHFINNVSIGVYPKIVQLRDRLQSYIGKWPAMVLASVVVLAKIALFHVQVEWDDHVIRRIVPVLFIGNNAYETSWPDTGSRKSLNKGILWLLVIRSKGGWAKLRAIILSLAGKSDEGQEIEIFETAGLTIRAFRRTMTIGIDGETLKIRSPLNFRCHPAALKVRVPADFVQ